ncbi:4'-phosphopantetheinyl transferase family protein [Thiocapsa bogorovii]|uniref:4'-phosphopantetheinyl transferase family protein n=1 Tax=Thiocapsa bogorovii TaxID=521689 RepID=UPI001E480671|nr:4'-phosphopantetheinyl transferase superfamily protein [Thiocapsa bogorovii]UHD15928.1 4'-phosphopantetheinyl transferase superfamily protein [Thiocapsa bogorovii]
MSIQRQDEDGAMAAPPTIDWAAGPIRCAIRSGEIHLWRIRTDATGIELAHGLSLLGARQRTRAARMRHQPYRERYVRAHAGLREILSRYLEEPPESLRFAYGPAGKPALASPAVPLSFNLTTTGDLALVAVCSGVGSSTDLGVDCEWIRPRHSIEAVAERMFAPEAVRDIASAPQHERLARFYRAWTALEADAKADGRGLFRPRPAGAQPPAVLHCIPETGYIAAVASPKLPPVSDWTTFDLLPRA